MHGQQNIKIWDFVWAKIWWMHTSCSNV